MAYRLIPWNIDAEIKINHCFKTDASQAGTTTGQAGQVSLHRELKSNINQKFYGQSLLIFVLQSLHLLLVKCNSYFFLSRLKPENGI